MPDSSCGFPIVWSRVILPVGDGVMLFAHIREVEDRGAVEHRAIALWNFLKLAGEIRDQAEVQLADLVPGIVRRLESLRRDSGSDPVDVCSVETTHRSVVPEAFFVREAEVLARLLDVLAEFRALIGVIRGEGADPPQPGRRSS